MNTTTVLTPRFSAHMGICVATQCITGLTRFHTVRHRGQLTTARIRSCVPRMADLCLISIISISPCGFPSATYKLGVWYSVVKTPFSDEALSGILKTTDSIKCALGVWKGFNTALFNQLTSVHSYHEGNNWLVIGYIILSSITTFTLPLLMNIFMF